MVANYWHWSNLLETFATALWAPLSEACSPVHQPWGQVEGFWSQTVEVVVASRLRPRTTSPLTSRKIPIIRQLRIHLALLQRVSVHPVLYYRGEARTLKRIKASSRLLALSAPAMLQNMASYGENKYGSASRLWCSFWLGIESTPEAHRGCLEAGGSTLAVLGEADVTNPRAIESFINKFKSGLVLSEHPWGRHQIAPTFPVIGLLLACRAVLAMEAPDQVLDYSPLRHRAWSGCLSCLARQIIRDRSVV